tara:strand:- start:381 stop:737 length:357 start_codon:yes stop_codon:yes gene_type:complete
MIKLTIAMILLFSAPAVANIWGNCETCNLPKPSENYTDRQKILKGLKDKKIYTTCRLKKRLKSQRTGRQACIYVGGNKTYTLMYEDTCPRQYRCIYNPGSKEPNIDDVLDSLNSIGKK